MNPEWCHTVWKGFLCMYSMSRRIFSTSRQSQMNRLWSTTLSNSNASSAMQMHQTHHFVACLEFSLVTILLWNWFLTWQFAHASALTQHLWLKVQTENKWWCHSRFQGASGLQRKNGICWGIKNFHLECPRHLILGAVWLNSGQSCPYKQNVIKCMLNDVVTGNKVALCGSSKWDVNEWMVGVCAELKLHDWLSDHEGVSWNDRRTVFQWYHSCCKNWEDDMTNLPVYYDRSMEQIKCCCNSSAIINAS